jgi:hypothetical protein
MQLLGTARPHLFTVAEYMTLDSGDRTELLGGVIYDVSPRNEPRRYAVWKLNAALAPPTASSSLSPVRSRYSAYRLRLPTCSATTRRPNKAQRGPRLFAIQAPEQRARDDELLNL